VNVRRGGLGRGLGALIPTAPAEEELTGARFEELPVDSIEPNPRQPREVFDPDSLAELVASIRAVGVLQPVVVRETDPGRYQLIMGERRWRATKDADLSVIPAIVRATSDDALLRDALLENLHRQQLNPLEEAAAYQQLLEEFGTTHEELAERVGRSRSHVSNTLRLLHLTPDVQRRVAAGVLSAGHARALLGLDDAAAQDRLAARIVAEGLSVRAAHAGSARPATATAGAGPGRGPALRGARHPGERGDGPAPGQACGRVRQRRGPRAHHRPGRAGGRSPVSLGARSLYRTQSPQQPGPASPHDGARGTGRGGRGRRRGRPPPAA
jgi:ParB family transcriptional regulator, chromosome partitioning protein